MLQASFKEVLVSSPADRGHAARRRMIGAILSAVFVSFLGMNETAAAAGPNLACGTTITTSTTLTRSLSCPAGDGVTLGRDVELDLGGHKLIGPGSTSGTGVTLSPEGGSSVVNGAVNDWQVGVKLEDGTADGPESAVGRVRMSNAGIWVNNGGQLTVSSLSATNSPIAADVNGHVTISDSRFKNSDIKGFMTFIQISNSTIIGGGISSVSSGSIKVDHSTLNGKGYDGNLGVCSETGIEITNSRVKNYKEGIRGNSCGVTLTGNDFSNMPHGVLGPVTSPFEDPNPYTFITNNRFTNSGVVLENGAMVVKNNQFIGNTTGIVFLEPQWSTAIGNTFRRNTQSGIKTELPGLSVGNNIAIRNGEYGIYAPNAVDLGGNIAFRNKVDQCVGLVCSPHR